MAPWIRFLEAFMVQQLLRTPAFHRGVEKVARVVHRIRHGTPPEEMGGTKIDQPDNHSFLKHFQEEIQVQMGRAEARPNDNAVAGDKGGRVKGQAKPGGEASSLADDEGADAVWQTARKSASDPPKKGFMGEYVGALREQMRSGK